MRGSNRRVALALAASLGLAACASQPRYGREDRRSVVAVEVTNRNWTDIVVWAVTPTQLVRLGGVTTGAHERFELPRSLNTAGGDLFLEARPVGSRNVIRSQPIQAVPGARVIWNVESAVAHSNLLIASAR